MKLTTYISVKKIIFILTIFRNSGGVLSEFFKTRLEELINDRIRCQSNLNRSPMFDMFNECARFDVLALLQDMAMGVVPLMSKPGWSKLVWQRALIIEDAFWASTNLIMRENDLLVGTMSKTNDLAWWELSDRHPEYMRSCKIMARLVCHSSRLKGDDCRYRGLPLSHRICTNCDLYMVEDAKLVLLQCPANNDMMIRIFDDIALKCPKVSSALNNDPSMNLMWLLGKPIPLVTDDEMSMARIIIANTVSRMYYTVIRKRTGIS